MHCCALQPSSFRQSDRSTVLPATQMIRRLRAEREAPLGGPSPVSPPSAVPCLASVHVNNLLLLMLLLLHVEAALLATASTLQLVPAASPHSTCRSASRTFTELAPASSHKTNLRFSKPRPSPTNALQARPQSHAAALTRRAATTRSTSARAVMA